MASALSAPYFHNEAAAYEHVEARIWPDGPFCPHCGECERISAIKPNPEKRVRIGLKKCGSCKKQFTVKVGTVFEQSHLPLHLWLQAIALITASKKGFSSNQLARTLGITIKAAWFMSHRIREAMAEDGVVIGGGGGDIEIDETFLGNQPNTFITGKGWRTKRGTGGMQKIVTIVERGGRARSLKVDSLRKDEITRALDGADRDSHLFTDSAQHYRRLGTEFLSHEMVDHGAGEYVRDETIHTNTVEGTFSIFKRGMRGIYQHCAEKHLPRYLAEFDFRYSNRAKLGVDDKARAERALKGIIGKRLTYRTTSARRPGAEARVVW